MSGASALREPDPVIGVELDELSDTQRDARLASTEVFARPALLASDACAVHLLDVQVHLPSRIGQEMSADDLHEHHQGPSSAALGSVACEVTGLSELPVTLVTWRG